MKSNQALSPRVGLLILALVGWLYMYATAQWPFIALGLATLAVGAVTFLCWSWATGGWPFGRSPEGPQ